MKAFSPRPADSSLVASRLAGLLETRRWLLVLLLSEAWLFAALVGALQWRSLAGLDRLALLVSATAIILGWTLSGRTIGLWLIMSGPLTLVLAALANGGSPSEVAWIGVSTSAGHVAYALVLLTGPVLGLMSILGCTVVLVFAWSLRPGNVVPGALAVADGRIAVALLAVSALVLWLAWHVLRRRAIAQDASRARLAQRVEAERETQERSRIWRAAAVSVHERLLSTLRYLLQTSDPDRSGLRTLIAEGGSLDSNDSPDDLERSVRVATAARIASGIVKLDESVIDIPVTDEVRVAARAAIVECALNAVLHGGATDVAISADRDGPRVRIHVTDNGSGIPETAMAGLGWTSVLDAGLEQVGGSWSVTSQSGRTTVTLTLPASIAPTTATMVDDGFAQGRTLLSAPLLAVGAVGIAFDTLAMSGTAGGLLIIALTAVAVLLGARIIVRGERPDLIQSSVILLALGITPWLAAYALPPSLSMQEVAPGMVTAGYAIIAVALWCRTWQFVGALAFWALGMIALTANAALDERQHLLIGLVNCLVIVPVVVIVVSLTARRFRRAQDALILQREALNRELVRANAASVIDSQLSACVAQTEAIVRRIADGAELDAATRHELACLEGLIRATIQVDPVSSGEFARVAARLCNAAFSHSIPVQVGTLISSPDTASLPTPLLQALESSIASADSITVRAVTSANEDHMSVLLSGPSVDSRAITALEGADLDGVKLDTEGESGTGVLVLITRPFVDTRPS
jgi:signal transduction histidine kinase